MIVKLATVAAITGGLIYWLLPKNGRKHAAGAEDRYQTSSKHRMIKPYYNSFSIKKPAQRAGFFSFE